MTRPPSPPRLALRLLERIVEREDDFGAAGDAEERFLDLRRERGARRAALDCWRQVLAALPGFIRNQSYWSLQMLKAYLKIAFRQLQKHKGYAFINVAGLTLGMACSLFILLWAQDELSYDRFHTDAKALYRVEHDQNNSGKKFHAPITPYGLGPALTAEIPEIADSTRAAGLGTLLVRFEDNAFYESRVTAVDPSFLSMFTFPFRRGSAATALRSPADLVVTEKFALKYFGTEEALGKTVIVNNAFPATVTAVLKDIPSNSSLRFDALLPISFLRNLRPDVDSWVSNTTATYVRLREGSSAAAVNAKITRLVRDRTLAGWREDADAWRQIQADPEQMKRFNSYVGPDYMVNPIVDIRFHGDFGYDRSSPAAAALATYSVIGLFVLLIACINFMNLATARSANRAREVGLRKVVGAFRRSLAGQFYGESVLTVVLAGLAAFALVVLLLPAFNAVAGKTLTLTSLLGWKFILGVLAVMALTGFVAGSYPALVLSSFQPVKVLKGRAGTRGAGLRKALVVLQFGLSVLLLIGMAVAARQTDFMRNKKLGYDQDQLVYLPMRGEAARNYAVLKQRLLRNPKILGVTATQDQPTLMGSKSMGPAWEGKDPNLQMLIGSAFVDFDYPETLKIEMAAGRTFDPKHPLDNGGTFLVNQALAKLMGLEPADAVGKRFSFMGIDGTIAGVMKDFHYLPTRYSIEPLAMAVGPQFLRYAVVRLKAGDIPAALKAVQAGWQEVNARFPFDHRFFDQDFDQQYRADERKESILKIFAILAVAIACLGLFGLASYTAEQKTREIGVRKVLGASVSEIVVLLSKEFIKWVLIANALAWPAAYFIMHSWLQQFAYRTSLSWTLFLEAGAGALFIAVLTVSFQAIRAARSDPVTALKYE